MPIGRSFVGAGFITAVGRKKGVDVQGALRGLQIIQEAIIDDRGDPAAE